MNDKNKVLVAGNSRVVSERRKCIKNETQLISLPNDRILFVTHALNPVSRGGKREAFGSWNSRIINFSGKKRRRRLNPDHGQLHAILLIVLQLVSLVLGDPTAAPSTATPSTALVETPSPTTGAPAAAPTPQPTEPTPLVPSSSPSKNPTIEPTSSFPSQSPSHAPTATYAPSLGPSTTPRPSELPTESPAPTSSPSLMPTLTPNPTDQPSNLPTDIPSEVPSEVPTVYPTFDVASQSKGFFQQKFEVDIDREFNNTEKEAFCDVMESYTVIFAEAIDAPPQLIQDNCTFMSQTLQNAPPNPETVTRKLRRSLLPDRGLKSDLDMTFLSEEHQLRRLADIVPDLDTFIQVDYSMSYVSQSFNVSTFAARFATYIQANLPQLTTDLQEEDLAVIESGPIFRVQRTDPPTVPPTKSLAPSLTPTQGTPLPSNSPSASPTSPTTGTEMPSMSPTVEPNSGSDGPSAAVVAVAVVIAGLAALGGGFYFYKRRKRKKELEAAELAQDGAFGGGSDWKAPGSPEGKGKEAPVISPSDSIMSNQSLLSAGNSMDGESYTEEDQTHHLADEFDEYKDQNLEKMRNDVEGNLAGFDGMMSQAMTRALMDDDENPVDRNEIYWGGTGDATEIEASALCEVNDWMKRKQGASVEERRVFMQDLLNKMVSSVRHGAIGPDQGSQTVHEAAALLGLELAVNIPDTAVIVSGMRKTVNKADLTEGFREFGEIEQAAVASNARGFGLVRFFSNKSVKRAMDKFRREEIVVQDVAVMLKVFGGGGSGNGRSLTEPRTSANANGGASEA